MGVTGVNPYAGSSTGVELKKTSNSSLSMDDFFSLLAAQLQNQNMFNPMQDTEFMGQMAQFSSLQQMQQLSGAFMATMAVNFLGKYAVAQTVDDYGRAQQTAGIVEKVDFSGSSPLLQINGLWFETGSVIELASQAPAPVLPVEEVSGETPADGTVDGSADGAGEETVNGTEPVNGTPETVTGTTETVTDGTGAGENPDPVESEGQTNNAD